MTDPEVTGQNLPAASGPAAAVPPGSAQAPVTDHDPALAQAPAGVPPAGVPPRRRWRWAVFALVAVMVVAGLAAGLVIWAPWTPPPVLRPAGLVAGHGTANSITFRWARPATGPPPDKYLILSDGRAAGSVAGTVTSYRQAGLTPASSYQYRVVAIRGGKRSPQSAPLAVSTLIPPMSQARLQSAWNVYAKNIGHVPHGRNGTLAWTITPACGPAHAT
jgi:hypothetical protein